MSDAATSRLPEANRYETSSLSAFCEAAFVSAGADDQTANAATRAMMHASRLGVDSHGVRLLPHYLRVIAGGRVKGRPDIKISGPFGAVATLDADDAHGAVAGFAAMDQAIGIARTMGLGAVAIRNSSHFGAAGAYAVHAAENGMIGLAFCNSDSFVRLHGGAERFHGTNPIACAVPSKNDRPWLLDMATSSIPYNRVGLYRSLGVDLPENVASDAAGRDTRDAGAVEMLAPLGGAYGFKGAALGGLVEILSAVVTGMKLSFDILPMNAPDLSTPRGLGAFVIAMRPDAFIGHDEFEAGMQRYVETLRSSAVTEGETVMAPGDREWAEERDRLDRGIPVDPDTEAEFAEIAERYGVQVPRRTSV